MEITPSTIVPLSCEPAIPRQRSSAASFLVICDTYPPVLGGSEIEAQRVCAAMMRRGYRPLVLCSGGSPMPAVRDWVDPEGVPVRILTRRSRGFWKNFIFGCQVAWQLWRERRNYEVVYFLMQGFQLFTGLPAARALGKPIVLKLSGSSVIPLMRQSFAGRQELRWARKWAARLLVLNQEMQVDAKECGFRGDRILRMPNPVDTGEFRPGTKDEVTSLRRRLAIPASCAVAVYVGRLAPEKGLFELIRGFAQAAPRLADALLVLVGDGSTRPALEKLACDLGIAERVRFPGRLNAADVALWLRASDIFCLTSPNEGFPCALAEAMAAGLPAVVSRIPGNTQLVEDGIHGFSIPFGDDAALARRLIDLLSEPALRRTMGQAARARIVERYSTDKVMALYEDLFEQVSRAPVSS